MERQDIFEPENFSALFERARGELKSGNTTAAIEQSDLLIGAYPDRAQAFMLKARAQALEDRRNDALQTLRSGLDHHPNDLKLLNMARNLALQVHGFDQAKAFADKITKLAPADTRNRAFLVQYDLQTKSYEAALSRASDLISDCPDQAIGWVMKAEVLLTQRRRQEALSTIEDALQEHPLHAKLLSLGRHIASLEGRTADAGGYATKLLAIAPDDHGNRAFLAGMAGDFSEIVRCADQIISEAKAEPRGWIMKADALVALHRIPEALEAVREALEAVGRNRRLLAYARNLSFRHGRFHDALNYARELHELAPEDPKIQLLLTRCLMAAGEFQTLGQFLKDAGPKVFEQPLRKSRRYFREYTRLRKIAPAIADAWRHALDNPVDRAPASFTCRSDCRSTMIQYWSQGTPPDDIRLVLSEWESLLEREKIGELKLFDRTSAGKWIQEHAPEFRVLFASAFHYAMESDIFRIAYASRHPCIYLDTDSWPLDHTAEILKFALRTGESMLYFRVQRPWIANGFFVAAPGCPFFAELVQQTLDLNLDDWPRNRLTVGKTFGPARYNKVLADLVRKSESCEVSSVTDVPGCSRLTIDGAALYFSHEAAVAAVKPPFTLGYTATGEYWKRLAVK